jgi:hypothetical protein
MPGSLAVTQYQRGDNGQTHQVVGTTDVVVPAWRGGLALATIADSTAVSNTASETAFDQYLTIPANTLIAGSHLRVRYWVSAVNTNGTDTLAVKCYIGTDMTAGAITGTALVSHAATDCSDGFVVSGEYELTVIDAGTGGHIKGQGTYKSIPAAEGTMTIKDDILASTSINTQAVQYIFCTATNNAANTGNNTVLKNLRVDFF